jgi:hypothetical protein
MHKRPNPACPIGRSIHHLLEGRMREAQNKLELSLSRSNLASLLENMD